MAFHSTPPTPRPAPARSRVQRLTALVGRDRALRVPPDDLLALRLLFAQCAWPVAIQLTLMPGPGPAPRVDRIVAVHRHAALPNLGDPVPPASALGRVAPLAWRLPQSVALWQWLGLGEVELAWDVVALALAAAGYRGRPDTPAWQPGAPRMPS